MRVSVNEWYCSECKSWFWAPRDLQMFKSPPTVSCPKCDSNCYSPKPTLIEVVEGNV